MKFSLWFTLFLLLFVLSQGVLGALHSFYIEDHILSIEESIQRFQQMIEDVNREDPANTSYIVELRAVIYSLETLLDQLLRERGEEEEAFPPPVASSLLFDGSSYVELSKVIEELPNTFEIWLKVERETTGRVGILLGNYPVSNNINWEIHTRGDPRIYWNNGQVDWRVDSIDVRTGEWEYIVFVRDREAGKMLCYHNGRLAAEIERIGSDVFPDSTYYIGGDKRGSSSPFFQGQIGEVRVWSRALSAAEIEEHYRSQSFLLGSRGGLLGFWDFHEGEDEFLYDRSSYGNHGTIYGAVYRKEKPHLIVD